MLAVLLCLVCLFDLACFFLSSFLLISHLKTCIHSVSPKGGKGGTLPPFHQANNYKGNSTDQLKIAQNQSQGSHMYMYMYNLNYTKVALYIHVSCISPCVYINIYIYIYIYIYMYMYIAHHYIIHVLASVNR